MSSETHGLASEQTVLAHKTHYEALRDHAMERRVPMSRHGLAVLLCQGMASWMNAWSRVSASAPRSTKDERPRPCPLPDESNAEVIRVLAAMALGHMEVHA